MGNLATLKIISFIRVYLSCSFLRWKLSFLRRQFVLKIRYTLNLVKNTKYKNIFETYDQVEHFSRYLIVLLHFSPMETKLFCWWMFCIWPSQEHGKYTLNKIGRTKQKTFNLMIYPFNRIIRFSIDYVFIQQSYPPFWNCNNIFGAFNSKVFLIVIGAVTLFSSNKSFRKDKSAAEFI